MKRIYKNNLELGDQAITKRTAQRHKDAINLTQSYDEVKLYKLNHYY